LPHFGRTKVSWCHRATLYMLKLTSSVLFSVTSQFP
jgi:ribosomal protein L30/L7E